MGYLTLLEVLEKNPETNKIYEALEKVKEAHGVTKEQICETLEPYAQKITDLGLSEEDFQSILVEFEKYKK